MDRYDYVKAWRVKMRTRLINAFDNGCGLCGYSTCHSALEFHHVDPYTKSFTIGASNIANWNKIVTEAKKCVMLCCRCHREVHSGIIELPVDIKRFDVSYEEWPSREQPKDLCPICNTEKHIRFKYCSQNCSNQGKRKVNWDEYDLQLLLETKNYTEIGKLVGVTGNAVKKRAVKLGLV